MKWEIELPDYHCGSSKTKNTYTFKSESSQQREATVTAKSQNKTDRSVILGDTV